MRTRYSEIRRLRQRRKSRGAIAFVPPSKPVKLSGVEGYSDAAQELAESQRREAQSKRDAKACRESKRRKGLL